MTTTVDKPRRSAGAVIKSYLPILTWLPAYEKGLLRGDFIAALTLWALLVPEAMVYAGIAGMPPETGLYAAPLALIAYAIFGSSRHLDVGPSSAVAALSFSVVAGILGASAVQSGEWVLLSIALAFMVGIMLIIGGFLRLGVLADFLSRPVLDGFVVGVAISIAVGQLDKVLGFEPEGYDFVPDILLFITDINMIDWPTFVVGAISLALLFALHKFTPKLPAALIVLFLAIAVSTLLDFDSRGIHIVGEIPGGLPPFGIPEELGLEELLKVAPGAIGVALVAFAESVAIARSFGTKFGYEVDANQELIAVGASNLGSGFSGAFVVDGSMSRTSAAVEAGAKTQMVSLIAAAAVLITAVALTPLFRNLPEATLGAIVIHAVWHNISFSKISQYRSITRLDYATAIVAMLGVLALGLLQGLVLAALLGLVVLLVGTKHRNTSVLGRVPETTVYRDIEHYPEGETYPGLLIIRFDGTLFFANAHDFVTAVRQAIAAADPPPRVVVIDGESINDIDATAVITIKEFEKQLLQTGIELRVARVKTQVLDVMRRAGLEEAIPAEHIYPTVQAAVDAYLAENEETQAASPNDDRSPRDRSPRDQSHSDKSPDDPLLKQGEHSAEVQSFTVKYWWLNMVRGVAALAIGIGLLLPFDLLAEADQLKAILFQFIGIYLLVSGIMSLVWGFSNHRHFGLWLLAGALGLVGGIAFFLRSFLEGHFSATVLTAIFGLIMLLAGLIHLLGGFRLGKAYGRRWSWGHEFLGLVEIAIGILLLVSILVPVENLRIILSFWGLIAGIGLIADGIRMRRLKKQQGELPVSHK